MMHLLLSRGLLIITTSHDDDAPRSVFNLVSLSIIMLSLHTCNQSHNNSKRELQLFLRPHLLSFQKWIRSQNGPGGQFDTSEFTLSTQPPSSGRRSTISVDTNHPAAAARQSKKHPLLDKSLRGARQRQMLLPTLFRCLNRHPGGRFPTRPPREFTPTPLGPWKCVAVVESIVVVAGEDSSRDGGEGG
jgi:hypothetical protein